MDSEDLPGPGGASLHEAANDLELAVDLLPHIPTTMAELADMRWAVANALSSVRREGASVAMLALAEELQTRAETGMRVGG